MLLVRNVSITRHSENNTFDVSCVGYNLTNCGLKDYSKHSAMIFFITTCFSVNTNADWFDDKGLQVIEKLTGALTRPKFFIGLIIAGFVALILQ